MDPLRLLLLLAAFAPPDGEATHTEVSSVWALSGGRAELPCPPRPRLPEDEALLVLWYRSSNTLPVYSYDARVGDFDAGDHWVDQKVLGERALFTTLSSPPTLVLESTLASDQGLYTCRIDYRLSPSTTNAVNLTVVLPPGPPVVVWGGVSVVGQLGPLTENARVRVICRSVGGRPPPMVTWWWRGSRLPNQVTTSSTHPTTGGRRVEATLVVVASREMQGAILTCHAQTPTPHHAHHTALLQPRSASVTLNVTLPPLEVRILGSGGPMSAGATLQLVCRTVGSHPPAELTWWRGHSRLTHVSYAFDGGGNVTTATLTVVVEREHDGATLACTAANPLLPHAPLTDSIKLKVFYTPVVRLSLGRHLTADLIKEGDDVFFECTIRANPTVHRVDWYHSGVPVVHNVTGGIVVSGLSLVVRRLRRRHSGFYTCAAANMEGWNTSNAIHLTVRHSPVCAGDVWERTQGAARGEPAVVVCGVEAVPAQGVTWAWTRVSEDGRERPIAEEDVRSEGLSSSVVVTPLTPEDYGQVSCRATNSVGRQRRPCLVSLVPAGPPDPLTNCSADPAALTEAYSDPLTWSLAVTCHEGFDGGLPQEFILEAWQEHVLVANMSSDFPEWVVCLRGGVATRLRMTASNARGRSDAHRLEVQAVGSFPEPETAALGVPTMLGAIVGLVSVLLLLLVLSVVIARHAGPCRAKGTNHEHKLVVTATGSAWECYDPDLVSSAQQRHPSLDVLANACGRRESLAHTQANAHTPAQPQTKTMVHIHSQTTPLMNGQVVNCQDELQADNACQECDCSSYSSCDSDVESVVEVIDLTAAGRSAAPRQPGGDDRLACAAPATGDPGVFAYCQ
ncbi:protein turtle homolog A-like [Panulirus ornatus]|uniref:protein turtle homolog A-like n=1 Tax=Panulirus ornatus TaxID=150431 RepID=UPI003A853947